MHSIGSRSRAIFHTSYQRFCSLANIKAYFCRKYFANVHLFVTCSCIFRNNPPRPVSDRNRQRGCPHKFGPEGRESRQFRHMLVVRFFCTPPHARWIPRQLPRCMRSRKFCRRNHKQAEIPWCKWWAWSCMCLGHPPLCIDRYQNHNTVVHQDRQFPRYLHMLTAQ
jgi:hypothetical protein